MAKEKLKLNALTRQEEDVIVRRSTELPFTGEYNGSFKEGIYACRRCNTPLYLSRNKFRSSCGWPSFDEEIKGRVKRIPDPDGSRVEIRCARCGAHLGHVFEGEHITEKNIRHCVNSISLKFIPKEELKFETVVLGGGCFWCTESVFLMLPGVLFVSPGYAGGKTENPDYYKVSRGDTGHAEVVRVDYDPKQITFSSLLEIFFSMHDPTTPNRQGADSGSQYRSIMLCTTDKQLNEAKKHIPKIQKEFQSPIVTEVKMLDIFYPAEEEHKNFYARNKVHPYCMLVISPKLDKIRKKFLK